VRTPRHVATIAAVGLLALSAACEAGPIYCERMEDVSSSLNALLNTAFLGREGVHDEFRDRFAAFRGDLEDFLDALPDEFDDQAAAAQTAVDAMSHELGSSPIDKHRLYSAYPTVTSATSDPLEDVGAACSRSP
jgi:hypothetical protein